VLTLNFDKESVNDIITDDFIDDLSPEIKNLRVFVKNYISKFIIMNIVEPIEPIMECSICLEGLNKDEDSCETPCCLQMFHRECVINWLIHNKKCPMCREKIRNKSLLFPIRERTEDEYTKDITIRKIRNKFLENIRERNEDTVYIDELEDDDNDGMPGLIEVDNSSFYDYWNRISSNNIDVSRVHHYIGLNMPAIGQMVPYDGDFDGDELNTYSFVNHSNVLNTEPIYYDDGLDELIFPNVNPIENPIINLSGRVIPYMEEPVIDLSINMEVMRNLYMNARHTNLTITNVENHIDVPIPRQINIGLGAIEYNPLQLPYFTSSENGVINVVNIDTMEEVD
jgi:hypothetical protein